MNFYDYENIVTDNKTIIGIRFIEKDGNNIIASCDRAVGGLIVYISSLKWEKDNKPLSVDEKQSFSQLFNDDDYFIFE